MSRTQLEQSLIPLLVSNLERLSKTEATEESDRTGVYQILGIFENLLSFLPPLASQISKETDMIAWLLSRISFADYDSNKQYASEILAIMLQNDRSVRLELDSMAGINPILSACSHFLQNDPLDSEQLEYMENLFNATCSLLAEPELRMAFQEEEGVDLMCLLLNAKGRVARNRALKVMAYALQGDEAKPISQQFVQCLGLKGLFAGMMGKLNEHPPNLTKKQKHLWTMAQTSPLEDEEYVVSILASLFTHLDSDSTERFRLLAKFVEKDWEKVERLLEMREKVAERVEKADKEIEREKQVGLPDE